MDPLVYPPDGDQDRGPELVAFTWTFTALASTIVALKVFTRIKIIREPGLDDIFIVFSLVSLRVEPPTTEACPFTIATGPTFDMYLTNYSQC